MKRFKQKIQKWKDNNELKKMKRFSYIEQYSTIFLHIPKAAGTSVYLSLFNSLGGGHTRAEKYLEIFGRSKYQAFFKFTFVRNPYDRVYSAYSFLKKGGMNSGDELFSQKHIHPYKDYKDFIINGLDKIPEIQNWVHFVPQYKFIFIKEKLAVDFIGRYENIEKDYKYIANVLGLENNLPHLNASNTNKEISNQYDSDMLKVINRIYHKDFRLLEYKIKKLNKK